MLERLHDAIGSPAKWADRAWITEDEQKYVRAWLAPLIAMARRIVLLEALALIRGGKIGDTRPSPRMQSKTSPKEACLSSPTPNLSWPYAAHKRPATLRLWPKPDKIGPRVRQVGPHLLVRDIWRERAREAQARHLNMVRFMREPPGVQLARRMEALARLIERPRAAIGRLARKLRAEPKLALALGCKRMPRTRFYHNVEYADAGNCAFDASVAYAFPDTS